MRARKKWGHKIEGAPPHRDREPAGAHRRGHRGRGRAAQSEQPGGLLTMDTETRCRPTHHQGADRQPRRDRVPRDPRVPRAGHRTVAVYSRGRRGALHVRMADEAVAIGPPPARESYLRVEKIVDACARTGADAVHPGYGFLSENADFAEACAAAGITFIGPPPTAMRAMGGKTAARALMQAAGVPVVPGDNGPDGRGFAERGGGELAARGSASRSCSRRRRAAAARACAWSTARTSSRRRSRRAQREAKARVRRRHRLPREGDRAAAPHRDPGVRRRARQRRPPLRARLLDPAPPPEGDRGDAVAGAGRRAARADGRGRGARGARRSATSAPAPSSSCSTRRRRASTSSR